MTISGFVRVHRRSLASLHQAIHGGLALLKRVDVRVKLILLGEVRLDVVRALALRHLGLRDAREEVEGLLGFGPGLAHAAPIVRASAHFFQSYGEASLASLAGPAHASRIFSSAASQAASAGLAFASAPSASAASSASGASSGGLGPHLEHALAIFLDAFAHFFQS